MREARHKKEILVIDNNHAIVERAAADEYLAIFADGGKGLELMGLKPVEA